jgi:hypothetical protein
MRKLHKRAYPGNGIFLAVATLEFACGKPLNGLQKAVTSLSLVYKNLTGFS